MSIKLDRFDSHEPSLYPSRGRAPFDRIWSTTDQARSGSQSIMITITPIHQKRKE